MGKVTDITERLKASNQECRNEDLYREATLDALAALQRGNLAEAQQHLGELLVHIESVLEGTVTQ